MATCDYGHEAEDVRILPIGDDASVHVCREHWAVELRARLEHVLEGGEDDRGLPSWDALRGDGDGR